MGHGYKGDTGHYHSITENIPRLKASYEYRDGYFAPRGKGRNYVRNLSCDDPIKTARDFYRKAAHGGREEGLGNGKGHRTFLKDGTVISFRETRSSDGTPVVDISIRKSNDHGDLKRQKIHFVKG